MQPALEGGLTDPGDIEGLSTQEAAEVAGIGEAAFKSRLHQARLRVRAAIGDEALASTGG